jgi:Ion channel
MIKSILVGLLLTMATVGIHAIGTTWWIERLRRRSKKVKASNSGFRELKILFLTSTLLLFLHILEVAIWAASYLAIPKLDHLRSFEEAAYFSIVTFTSLGYGDIVIGGSWRLLSGIQSMAGLFVFGWSTALLFAIYQRLWYADDSE